MSFVELDPLPATDWEWEDIVPNVTPRAITWNYARIIEQMCDALHTRQDYIGIARTVFSFGIGTGSAAGVLLGKDDGLLETLNGFISLPTWNGRIAQAPGFLHRTFATMTGAYTGDDLAAFDFTITSFAEPIFPTYSIRKNGTVIADAIPFDPTDISGLQLVDGVGIVLFGNAPGPDPVDSHYLDNFEARLVTLSEQGSFIRFRCLESIRRTAYNISYILLNEIGRGLEYTVNHWGTRSVDGHDHAFQWVTPISEEVPPYKSYEGEWRVAYRTSANFGSKLVIDTWFPAIPHPKIAPPAVAYPSTGGMRDAMHDILTIFDQTRWVASAWEPVTGPSTLSVSFGKMWTTAGESEFNTYLAGPTWDNDYDMPEDDGFSGDVPTSQWGSDLRAQSVIVGSREHDNNATKHYNVTSGSSLTLVRVANSWGSKSGFLKFEIEAAPRFTAGPPIPDTTFEFVSSAALVREDGRIAVVDGAWFSDALDAASAGEILTDWIPDGFPFTAVRLPSTEVSAPVISTVDIDLPPGLDLFLVILNRMDITDHAFGSWVEPYIPPEPPIQLPGITHIDTVWVGLKYDRTLKIHDSSGVLMYEKDEDSSSGGNV